MASSLGNDSDPLVEDENHGEIDDSVDVVIWFRDKTGIHVTLKGGEVATSDDLFNIVVDKKMFETDNIQRQLPPGCEMYFSVWLCSSLLELRLKKDHIPFQIAQLWDDFCQTYTDASSSQIARDEPVVMIQRNVFLTLEEEMKITNEDVLCLLYHEAKFNVNENRYPMSLDDYGKLAGIQAFVEFGSYDGTKHTADLYKREINNFFPEDLHKSHSRLGVRKHDGQSLDERLRTEHELISMNYRDVSPSDKNRSLYREYLKICWTYAFYGSAFFDALLQKPHGKVMSNIPGVQKTVDVYIAINTDGVCIIDRIGKEAILAVPFEQLSWEIKHTDEGMNKLPCLLLQFPGPIINNEKISKVLQVYSKQARMMDAIITTCVGLKKQRKSQPTSFPQRDIEEGQRELYRNGNFSGKIANKLEKMTLSTYDMQGKKITKKK